MLSTPSILIKHPWLLLWLWLGMSLLTSPARAQAQVQAESRLALLIGNAQYKSVPLKNPVNDVRLMEATLIESGFTVIKAENASRRDMLRLVRDFGERLKQSGGVGLFYFAGHGIQVKGANYLVPIDADIRAEDEIAFDSVDAQSILEKMETAKNRINLLILDACRDNPFAKNSRSGSAGLATMSAPSGSLIAYATAPGQVASDGAGQNGLYTHHLAAAMRSTDLPIEEVFKRVRANVRKDSANQQTPWENTALEGHFYFKRSSLPEASAASLAAPPTATSMTVELAYWDTIKNSNRAFELQAYIDQFPNGAFVGLAKARLRDMNQPQTQVATAAPMPAPALAVSKPNPPAAPSLVGSTLFEGQNVGTLVYRDEIFKNNKEQVITVLEKTQSHITLSSGDKVGTDGQVLAVRMGERLVVPKPDSTLWKLPLQAGQRGKANVLMAGQEGRLIWQVKAGSRSGHLVMQVDYDFTLRGATSVLWAVRTGSWTGEYAAGEWFVSAGRYSQNAHPTAGGEGAHLLTTTLVLSKR